MKNPKDNNVSKRIYNHLLNNPGFPNVYLPKSSVVRYVQGVIEILVSDDYMSSRIQEHSSHISKAIKETLGKNTNFKIEINRGHYEKLFPEIEEPKKRIEGKKSSIYNRYDIESSYFMKIMKKLNFSNGGMYDPSKLISHRNNDYAIRSVRDLVEEIQEDKPFSAPFCIIGPNGSGKTSTLYLAMDSFGKQGIISRLIDIHKISSEFQKGEGKKPDSLKNFDEVGVFLLDSIEGLFHNGRHREGCQNVVREIMAYSQRKVPLICSFRGSYDDFSVFKKNIGKKNIDLEDRFNGLKRIEINPPEKGKDRPEFLRELILSSSHQVKEENLDELVLYLDDKFSSGSSIREIKGNIETAFGNAEYKGLEINKDTLSRASKGYQTHFFSPPDASSSNILEKALPWFPDITIKQITSKSRKGNVVRARRGIVYLMRELSEGTIGFDEIGGVMGGRTYATIINLMNKVEKNFDEKERQAMLEYVKKRL